MHKNTLWLLFALLCIYLTLVFCEEQTNSQQVEEVNKENGDISKDIVKSETTDLLEEEGRTRRHRHHLYHMWGWHALAIAYLVKLKVVVVAFFVGSAIYLGLRYFWPHKCNTEIILDHPPPGYSHHDHIPYSLSHSEHYADHPPFDATSFSSSSGPGASFEPYSAYSGSFDGGSDVVTDTTSTDTQSYRKKREVPQREEETDTEDEETDTEDEENEDHNEDNQGEARQRPHITEEQIGHFMFSFLGLDSKACRRRFICEMEFRSKVNPLTAMAFRVIGRSFFGQYINDHNEMGRAHSYQECAAVNSECVFIENEEEEEEAPLHNEEATEAQELATESTDDVAEQQENSLENNNNNNNIEERNNYHNLLAERRNSYWRRVRGDRNLKL